MEHETQLIKTDGMEDFNFLLAHAIYNENGFEEIAVVTTLDFIIYHDILKGCPQNGKNFEVYRNFIYSQGRRFLCKK